MRRPRTRTAVHYFAVLSVAVLLSVPEARGQAAKPGLDVSSDPLRGDALPGLESGPDPLRGDALPGLQSDPNPLRGNADLEPAPDRGPDRGAERGLVRRPGAAPDRGPDAGPNRRLRPQQPQADRQ